MMSQPDVQLSIPIASQSKPINRTQELIDHSQSSSRANRKIWKKLTVWWRQQTTSFLTKRRYSHSTFVESNSAKFRDLFLTMKVCCRCVLEVIDLNFDPSSVGVGFWRCLFKVYNNWKQIRHGTVTEKHDTRRMLVNAFMMIVAFWLLLGSEYNENTLTTGKMRE